VGLRLEIPAACLALLAASCGGGSGGGHPVSGPDARDTSFVRLEGGDFVTSWGDTVLVAPFEIGRYEVSNRLYTSLALQAHLDLPPDPAYPGLGSYFTDNPDLPAINMSAVEADSAADVIGCRLPTAAEWEYAASRGLTGPIGMQFPWGDLAPSEAGEPANYLAGDDWDSRNLDGYLFLAPIGSFPLSSAGLADMAGNASEWTRPESLSCRIYGGAWLSPSEELRIGSWRRLSELDRARHIGFRLVR